jgi:hypothetical protein
MNGKTAQFVIPGLTQARSEALELSIAITKL